MRLDDINIKWHNSDFKDLQLKKFDRSAWLELLERLQKREAS
jgi:hypothetical protein